MKIQYEGTYGLRDKERDRWNYEGTDNSQGSGLNPVGSEMVTTRDFYALKICSAILPYSGATLDFFNRNHNQLSKSYWLEKKTLNTTPNFFFSRSICSPVGI
jgi:hypothetical protein